MTITKKKHGAASIPEAIIYIQLTLPSSIPADMLQIEDLRETLTLQAQGEAVEVSEEYPIPLLMIAFDVVHKTSPEMILRLNSGKQVLLFDHWNVPVLRDENIQMIPEITASKKAERFTPELIINLDDIWEKTHPKEKDDLEAVRNSLEKTEKVIRPAEVTTLIGNKAPALLFLLTQHLLYGKTREIWYQESLTSKPIKITQI